MASIITASNKGDDFARQIMEHVERQIDVKAIEIQKKYQDLIVKELFETRKDVVAQAAIRIAKYSSIQYMENRIVIEIMDNKENNNETI